MGKMGDDRDSLADEIFRRVDIACEFKDPDVIGLTEFFRQVPGINHSDFSKASLGGILLSMALYQRELTRIVQEQQEQIDALRVKLMLSPKFPRC